MVRRGIELPEVIEGNHCGAFLEALGRGMIRMEEVLAALGAEYGLEVVSALPGKPDRGLDRWIPAEMAERHQILPLVYEEGHLGVAVADPLDVETIDDLSHRLNLSVELRLADPFKLRKAIEIYGQGTAEGSITPMGEEGRGPRKELSGQSMIEGISATVDDEGPIIRLVERMMATAIRHGASDLHLEPMEGYLRVRFRIDGRLREIERQPFHLQLAVVSRLKLMAGLSLAEKRRPQDGRIRMRADGKDYDFRVSSLPSIHGESMVMRILDQEGLRFGMSELGMFRDDENAFARLIGLSDGIFLVTGPTGSGKSTTLYAVLHHLNSPERKIITVEDPVEYQIRGINQVAVHRATGMDFAAALRAMLRQAPDIIMVGEIRDYETAEIAVNASLTGHRVFSTMHTNDAPSSICRLLDLGAKPYLVATALRAAMAQRLVRMICPKCRETYVPSDAELKILNFSRIEWGDRRLTRGRGCQECGGSGFFRRRGIFELLVVEGELERLIHEEASLVEIRRRARAGGMRSMREDGIRKVLAGWTSLAEVLAVTGE